MRVHIKETLVERCVDCPSAKSPLNEVNGEWRCREASELDDRGNGIGYRVIPMADAWHGFPAWCPLQEISAQKWASKEANRKIQSRKAGRLGVIETPENWM